MARPRRGAPRKKTKQHAPPNRVGRLRRSHVVGTYGPGAVMDFRTSGTGVPVSGVLAGLEEWDAAAPSGQAGLLHFQSIHEPRLEKRLHVSGFRQPPVLTEEEASEAANTDILPVVRYPDWLQCPQCNRIMPATQWLREAGRPERWCPSCGDDDDRVYAVPVRFIVACEDGHLDEFPWKVWIGCRCERPRLFLRQDGPGLGGKVVECRNEDCVGKPRSLEGAFQKNALVNRGLKCRGHEPWLAVATPPPCDKVPRVLQRGASNVYWGIPESSLDIPPFSSDLSCEFGNLWPHLENKPSERWPELIELLDIEKLTGKPAPVLLSILHEWKKAADQEETPQPIEWAEYLQFRQSALKPVVEGEYETQPEPTPAEIDYWIDAVVLAKRLREVRALKGFTRITPPGGMFRSAAQRSGRLAIAKQDWLPGVAMRGEGIFLRFREETLKAWESNEPVRARMKEFNDRVAADLSEGEQQTTIPARLLLIHSFAHALMRRLSLECGYSSSALRERLYVGEDPFEMAGVLIHTGTPDSEGTLGGLVRQGKAARLVETILGALQDCAWCSSDPVCITGTATLSSPRNGAACHACVLVPETSCQHFNVLLDRALLVGTDEHPELGYFRDLIGSDR